MLLSPAESRQVPKHDWTVIVLLFGVSPGPLVSSEGRVNTGTDFTSVAGTVCTSSSVSESVSTSTAVRLVAHGIHGRPFPIVV